MKRFIRINRSITSCNNNNYIDDINLCRCSRKPVHRHDPNLVIFNEPILELFISVRIDLVPKYVLNHMETAVC